MNTKKFKDFLNSTCHGLTQKGKCWTWNQKFRGSILTGDKFQQRCEGDDGIFSACAESFEVNEMKFFNKNLQAS